MRAAGGALNLDTISKKPSVNDGKSRLFGLAGDENQYQGAPQQAAQGGGRNTGKRVLQPGAGPNTYSNVIGGSYQMPEETMKQQPSRISLSGAPLGSAAMMYGAGAGVPPI